MTTSALICLSLITTIICFAFIIQVIGKGLKDLRLEAAKRAETAIALVRKLLNLTPEVSIGASVSAQKTTGILEVAFISKEFPIEYVYENKFLQRTKKLILRGQYTVKAGFDLRGRFNIEIDETSKRVHADFQGSRILSIQQNGYKVILDTDGWWNKLNQKEQELALNEMNRKAEDAALEMQVCGEANASLHRQLLELAKTTGQEWKITFRDEPLLGAQDSLRAKMESAASNPSRFFTPPFNCN
jgi:hypothetical protein